MHREIEAVVLQTRAPRHPRTVALAHEQGSHWRLTVDAPGDFGVVRLLDVLLDETDPAFSLVFAIVNRSSEDPIPTHA
ncbi:MAG: hypothetical protein ACR2J8_00080 [Thermomicrobiales bacterium]